MNIATKKHLPRRTFLKAAGATMALPFLEAMRPAFARTSATKTPRRIIAINVDLGFMPESFFPKTNGKNFELSPYLKPLAPFRDQLTVFNGVSHPEVNGGHATDICFLTGAPHPNSPGFKNSISLDQFAAQQIGHHTRFPTLNLRVGPGNGSLAYTSDGVRLPSENRPSSIYKQLFVQGSPAEIEAQMRKLREGQSLMDSFGDRIKSLQRDVTGPDRDRLEQYFTSVREVEKRLVINQEWQHKPKPAVTEKAPQDNLEPGALITRTRNIYDLSRLALETDSTRLITIFVTQGFNPKVSLPGVELPHHALTHQVSKGNSREQLAIIERAQMTELANLLKGLSTAGENGESGQTLLDHTMVMQGSNLGNAARHDNRNLPVLLAGGGLKHAGHLRYDAKNNEPLAALYLTMLHRLGLETKKFATATSPIKGLELG